MEGQLTEPTSSLVYLARALAPKYGVPVRVAARGDSAGAIGIDVFTWRNNAWVKEPDGYEQVNAITCPNPSSPEARS